MNHEIIKVNLLEADPDTDILRFYVTDEPNWSMYEIYWGSQPWTSWSIRRIETWVVLIILRTRYTWILDYYW